MKKILFYISLLIVCISRQKTETNGSHDYREKYAGSYTISSHIRALQHPNDTSWWVREYDTVYTATVYIDKNQLKIFAMNNDILLLTMQDSGKFVFRHSSDDSDRFQGRFSNDSVFFKRWYSDHIPIFSEHAVGVKSN